MAQNKITEIEGDLFSAPDGAGLIRTYSPTVIEAQLTLPTFRCMQLRGLVGWRNRQSIQENGLNYPRSVFGLLNDTIFHSIPQHTRYTVNTARNISPSPSTRISPPSLLRPDR